MGFRIWELVLFTFGVSLALPVAVTIIDWPLVPEDWSWATLALALAQIGATVAAVVALWVNLADREARSHAHLTVRPGTVGIGVLKGKPSEPGTALLQNVGLGPALEMRVLVEDLRGYATIPPLESDLLWVIGAEQQVVAPIYVKDAIDETTHVLLERESVAIANVLPVGFKFVLDRAFRSFEVTQRGVRATPRVLAVYAHGTIVVRYRERGLRRLHVTEVPVVITGTVATTSESGAPFTEQLSFRLLTGGSEFTRWRDAVDRELSTVLTNTDEDLEAYLERLDHEFWEAAMRDLRARMDVRLAIESGHAVGDAEMED